MCLGVVFFVFILLGGLLDQSWKNINCLPLHIAFAYFSILDASYQKLYMLTFLIMSNIFLKLFSRFCILFLYFCYGLYIFYWSIFQFINHFINLYSDVKLNYWVLNFDYYILVLHLLLDSLSELLNLNFLLKFSTLIFIPWYLFILCVW